MSGRGVEMSAWDIDFGVCKIYKSGGVVEFTEKCINQILCRTDGSTPTRQTDAPFVIDTVEQLSVGIWHESGTLSNFVPTCEKFHQ